MVYAFFALANDQELTSRLPKAFHRLEKKGLNGRPAHRIAEIARKIDRPDLLLLYVVDRQAPLPTATNLIRPSGGSHMRYLHTMLRVRNLEIALKFYVEALGLKEVRRVSNDKGRFTLVFLCAPEDENLVKQSKGRGAPLVELTYNWAEETYGEDRFFGHLAYEVDDIYATCERLMSLGITINRPPRDGQMAFIRSPDLHSIELLQKGDALPSAEPWSSMPNTGHW
jgi:lactoylglutathione lyase